MTRQLLFILLSLSLTAVWPTGTATAQQTEQRTFRQQMDASQVHVVRLELALTGTLDVTGRDGSDVIIEALAPYFDSPSCPVALAQQGDTLTVTMQAAAGVTCSPAMNIHVEIPHAYDVIIVATQAEQARVRDLSGTVYGTIHPATSIYTGSYTASQMKIEGATFHLRDLRGELTLGIPPDQLR